MQRYQPRRTGTAGFSLIELMVTLVLIAVTVSLAAPSLNRYVSQNKTRRALDQVGSDLAFARMMAVRSGYRAVLEFGSSGRTYTVWVARQAPDTVKRVNLGRDYPGLVVVPPTTDRRVEFDSRGLVRNIGTGRISASSAEQSDTLRISVSGRVYRDY